MRPSRLHRAGVVVVWARWCYSRHWVCKEMLMTGSGPAVHGALERLGSPSGLPHRRVGSPHWESTRRELCDERRECRQVSVHDVTDRVSTSLMLAPGAKMTCAAVIHGWSTGCPI